VSSSSSRKIWKCRICDGEFLDYKLKLQDSPLANELFETRELALKAELFELEIAICSICKGNQLTTIVSAERLFSNYSYDSGVSKEMTSTLKDCAKYISTLVTKDSKILEIGSNDGTLMKELKIQYGLSVVGIEPSKRHAEICNGLGLSIVHGLANEISLSQAAEIAGKKFSLVVGNNVFAHIDNLIEVIKQISNVLTNDGLLIFEVSYFGKVVKNGLFDTIYHEHMSYHSVTSVEHLLGMSGFSLVDLQEIPAHGGSIRVTAKRGNHPRSEDVAILVMQEAADGLNSDLCLRNLFEHVRKIETESNDYISSRISTNSTLSGYGAPAKAVTFITELGLQDLPWLGIVEDNVFKQGKYLPQSGIRLMSSIEYIEQLRIKKIESVTVVILPWNMVKEITAKISQLFNKSRIRYESVCLFPRLQITSKGNE
jgi:SAM-dependent methyltransferase